MGNTQGNEQSVVLLIQLIVERLPIVQRMINELLENGYKLQHYRRTAMTKTQYRLFFSMIDDARKPRPAASRLMTSGVPISTILLSKSNARKDIKKYFKAKMSELELRKNEYIYYSSSKGSTDRDAGVLFPELVNCMELVDLREIHDNRLRAEAYLRFSLLQERYSRARGPPTSYDDVRLGEFLSLYTKDKCPPAATIGELPSLHSSLFNAKFWVCRSVEVGDGWYVLVKKVLQDIEQINALGMEQGQGYIITEIAHDCDGLLSIQATQQYGNGANKDSIMKIVGNARKESGKICEICADEGYPHMQPSNGKMRVRCFEHSSAQHNDSDGGLGGVKWGAQDETDDALPWAIAGQNNSRTVSAKGVVAATTRAPRRRNSRASVNPKELLQQSNVPKSMTARVRNAEDLSVAESATNIDDILDAARPRSGSIVNLVPKHCRSKSVNLSEMPSHFLSNAHFDGSGMHIPDSHVSAVESTTSASGGGGGHGGGRRKRRGSKVVLPDELRGPEEFLQQIARAAPSKPPPQRPPRRARSKSISAAAGSRSNQFSNVKQRKFSRPKNPSFHTPSHQPFRAKAQKPTLDGFMKSMKGR